MICAVMGASQGSGTIPVAPGAVHGLHQQLEDRTPQHVLVLTPDAFLSDARREAAVLVAADHRWSVCVYPLQLGVLALQLIAVRVQEVGPDPGAAVRLVHALGERAVSALWLRSVAGLERPRATVGQYLRSLFPTKGFAVDLADPGIAPSTAEAWASLLRDVPEVLIAGEVPSVVHQQISAATGGRMVSIEAISHVRTLYGHRRGAEVAWLLSVDAEDPVQVVACPACGARNEPGPCPYCHAEWAPARLGDAPADEAGPDEVEHVSADHSADHSGGMR